ncbi:MAG: hypothetical protein ACD_16C00192G0016 [uncultured bacterium]|nr:MAG: hypothetical protein ACD_16C00192G0016 [uncultured bacterium]OFW68170.1 MAG: Flp pilus assembly protein CpaB [Alphaproteobacteria bacterium GWC2_42_16]OFW73563.1 MAG: Flp pilus assembly protein CpaB [Alphaproteobacteria bacterium GWA2_41_27]OFW82412.1 MAG: Flp pilus assembly protein CpaB [Alphaproteobacteria bacterium RIFCSPHIGHO2_12_FULL_42_100]OFW86236.1 MAG: Flp pilus assembly protein CpaB [Alphaproteobacteria bacterium RBG_16_42_14]OFW91796.1 MAG: Flp pilus assembly protein CpaB [A
MRFRDLIGLFVAIVLAISIAFLTRFFIVSEEGVIKPSPEAVSKNKILVAGKHLNIGEKIKSEDLVWQLWPEAALQETYIKEGTLNLQSLVGAVVLEELDKGEPVFLSNFIKQGEKGILAAILPSGKRAISIPVTAETSSSGLIIPGDYVDVILSKTVNQTGQSLTIARNLKVLAFDTKLDTSSDKPVVPKVATLEVTPAEAELITASSREGTLSLSLYSVAETKEQVVEEIKTGTVTLMKGNQKTQVQVNE